MDLRVKDAIKSWVKDAGILYALVILFVSLCFLLKNSPDLFSCNPSLGKSAALSAPPGYYGRSP